MLGKAPIISDIPTLNNGKPALNKRSVSRLIRSARSGERSLNALYSKLFKRFKTAERKEALNTLYRELTAWINDDTQGIEPIQSQEIATQTWDPRLLGELPLDFDPPGTSETPISGVEPDQGFVSQDVVAAIGSDSLEVPLDSNGQEHALPSFFIIAHSDYASTDPLLDFNNLEDSMRLFVNKNHPLYQSLLEEDGNEISQGFADYLYAEAKTFKMWRKNSNLTIDQLMKIKNDNLSEAALPHTRYTRFHDKDQKDEVHRLDAEDEGQDQSHELIEVQDGPVDNLIDVPDIMLVHASLDEVLADLSDRTSNLLMWFNQTKSQILMWPAKMSDGTEITNSSGLGTYAPDSSSEFVSIVLEKESDPERKPNYNSYDGSWSYKCFFDLLDQEKLYPIDLITRCFELRTPIGVAQLVADNFAVSLGIALVTEIQEDYFGLSGFSKDGKIVSEDIASDPYLESGFSEELYSDTNPVESQPNKIGLQEALVTEPDPMFDNETDQLLEPNFDAENIGNVTTDRNYSVLIPKMVIQEEMPDQKVDVYVDFEDIVSDLEDERHSRILRWFFENTGTTVGWPQPFPDGTLIAAKAKAIYKPEWSTFSVSVRENIESPYPDQEPVYREDGTWSYRYFQENVDPDKRDDAYTNRGLMECLRSDMPVGVMKQISPKPESRYEILGVALIKEWVDGYFVFEGFSPNGKLPLDHLEDEDSDVSINEEVRIRQSSSNPIEPETPVQQIVNALIAIDEEMNFPSQFVYINELEHSDYYKRLYDIGSSRFVTRGNTNFGQRQLKIASINETIEEQADTQKQQEKQERTERLQSMNRGYHKQIQDIQYEKPLEIPKRLSKLLIKIKRSVRKKQPHNPEWNKEYNEGMATYRKLKDEYDVKHAVDMAKIPELRRRVLDIKTENDSLKKRPQLSPESLDRLKQNIIELKELQSRFTHRVESLAQLFSSALWEGLFSWSLIEECSDDSFERLLNLLHEFKERVSSSNFFNDISVFVAGKEINRDKSVEYEKVRDNCVEICARVLLEHQSIIQEKMDNLPTLPLGASDQSQNDLLVNKLQYQKELDNLRITQYRRWATLGFGLYGNLFRE